MEMGNGKLEIGKLGTFSRFPTSPGGDLVWTWPWGDPLKRTAKGLAYGHIWQEKTRRASSIQGCTWLRVSKMADPNESGKLKSWENAPHVSNFTWGSFCRDMFIDDTF